MSWSYDITLPKAKDRIRFLTGDTDEAEALFSDEEIEAVLSQTNDETAAALQLARALAARFSRRADASIAGVRENLSQLAGHYWTLADRLERQRAESNAASGLGVHGVADEPVRLFETAAFDNPRASTDDEGRA
jgi:hypothetical protein